MAEPKEKRTFLMLYYVLDKKITKGEARASERLKGSRIV
jgi:hypothetical protein